MRMDHDQHIHCDALCVSLIDTCLPGFPCMPQMSLQAIVPYACIVLYCAITLNWG